VRRIRTRLVFAFVVVALLPAVPLSALVRNLLERSFEPPFEAQVESALTTSLGMSRARLREEKQTLARWVEDEGARGAPGSARWHRAVAARNRRGGAG